MAPSDGHEQRVLVFARFAGDGAHTARILASAGIRTETCTSAERLCEAIDEGAGAVVLADEILTPSAVEALRGRLERQPPWSDLPILVSTLHHELLRAGRGPGASLGSHANLVVLERPVSVRAMLSAVESALRARRRQYQARDLYDQTRTILESITDAFFALDGEGRFTYVNRHAEHLLGRPKAALLGTVFWDEYPGMRESEFARACHKAAVERVAASATSFSPDSARWYEVHAYPASDGVSVYFRDISEQKQAERDRASLLAAAQAANRAKDDFLAMLGHELRNPLAPILMATSLLRMRGQAPVREVDVLERQGKHLARLVDDLLDMSRITSGKLVVERQFFDLHEAIAQAIESTRPLFLERGVTLRADGAADGLPILGDRQRMVQVVTNLLVNAAKFTPAGKGARVEARVQGEEIVVEVIDEGRGIPADLLPRIFDRFTQGAQTADRSHGGLGLGLAIARGLVTAHGGSIAARSDGPGLGCAFTIRLPRARARSASKPPSESLETHRALDKPLVLIVDDNGDSAALLSTVLTELGYETRAASDGPSALSLVEDFVPHAALLDIGLPGMDGYELATRLRAKLRSREPVFIAITGYSEKADHGRAVDAGFADYMTKPVDLARLMITLERCLRPAAAASAP